MNTFICDLCGQKVNESLQLAIIGFINYYSQSQHNKSAPELIEDNRKKNREILDGIAPWALANHNMVFQHKHVYANRILPEDPWRLDHEQRKLDALLAEDIVNVARVEIYRAVVDDLKNRPREESILEHSLFEISYPDLPNLTSKEICNKFVLDWSEYGTRV